MISLDRKLCKDILRFTSDYNASVIFDPALGGFAHWHMSHPDAVEMVSSIPANEVSGSLARLEQRSMVRIIQRSAGGSVIFRITPELLHAKSFWWDRFTKTYLAGFISGVLTAVVGGLLLHWLTQLP